MKSKIYYWAMLCLCFVCIVSFLIQLLALNPAFLLDDFQNLKKLFVVDYKSFHAFVFSNDSGPLGRPVSIASFALDDAFWPSNALLFKHTNILLHLVCTLLVFWFSYLLASVNANERFSLFFAICVTALWTVSASHLATVQYVIQRMTILSAIFCLGAGVAYVKARARAHISSVQVTAYTITICVLLSLALLSKESAAMFFVVLVLIELVFFEGKGLSRSQKYFLFLLLSLVPIYLLVFSIGVCLSADKVFAFRGYSFEERMLFFPASLLNYASGALSIDLRVPSVFHDDFLVRQRGLSAAVHVFNWAALVALIGFVWRNRRAAKLFAVGGFGFVALHYLEGMPTPIEPYFSHRNYLPSAFMLIACCSGLLLFLKSFKNVRVVFLTSVFSYFCFVSAIAALTWGNTFSLAYSWSIQYPDSLRAQRYYADELSRLGSPANSLKVDFYSAQRFPEALGPVINAIRSQCKIGGDLTEGLQELNRRVGAFNLTRGDVLTVNSTLRNIEAMGGGKCFVTEVEKQLFFGFLEQYAGVEIFRRYKRLGADMNFIKGLFHAQVGDLASAIGALDEADMLMPSVDIMMYRANWLMTAGLKELALEALDIAIERDRLLNGAGASRLEELRLMRARYEQY